MVFRGLRFLCLYISLPQMFYDLLYFYDPLLHSKKYRYKTTENSAKQGSYGITGTVATVKTLFQSLIDATGLSLNANTILNCGVGTTVDWPEGNLVFYRIRAKNTTNDLSFLELIQARSSEAIVDLQLLLAQIIHRRNKTELKKNWRQSSRSS